MGSIASPDDRAIFFFDIDNCLYQKSKKVHDHMALLINKFFINRLSLTCGGGLRTTPAILSRLRIGYRRVCVDTTRSTLWSSTARLMTPFPSTIFCLRTPNCASSYNPLTPAKSSCGSSQTLTSPMGSVLSDCSVLMIYSKASLTATTASSRWSRSHSQQCTKRQRRRRVLRIAAGFILSMIRISTASMLLQEAGSIASILSSPTSQIRPRRHANIRSAGWMSCVISFQSS